MRTDTALWQAINAYDIDAADAVLPFSRRLARDNKWSQAHARDVVAEYKRFIYLACVAGHVVTPSEDVDQAWHLHLIYTRDYWNRFCGEVLQRPMHHTPTEGGMAEDARFFDAYADTLSLYDREFGEAPPPAIWPSPQTRFKLQTNASDVIHLPKRQVFLCLAAALPLFLAACSARAVEKTVIDHPVTFIVGGTILVMLISAAFGGGRNGRRRRRKNDGSCSSGCGSSFFGCGSSDGGSSQGCSSDGGSSGCSSSGCGSSGCGGGCGGGGD